MRVRSGRKVAGRRAAVRDPARAGVADAHGPVPGRLADTEGVRRGCRLRARFAVRVWGRTRGGWRWTRASRLALRSAARVWRGRWGGRGLRTPGATGRDVPRVFCAASG